MDNFKEGELEITVGDQGGKTAITWLGKSKDRDPAAMLDPYFAGIIDELEGKELLVDFTKFEFMNSSTVTAIIKFVKMLADKNITTLITYNEKIEWQYASFKALETVVMRKECITVKG